MNKQTYEKTDVRLNRPIEGCFPYVYLDRIIPKYSWGGKIRNVSVLIAFGVPEDDYKEILRAAWDL
jgi:transposase-like protein